MASQGSSTTACSASTAGALAAAASSSEMAQASSPSQYQPLSPGRLSVNAKPFYPTTGSSSSMEPMASLSVNAKPFYPTTGSSSSIEAMASLSVNAKPFYPTTGSSSSMAAMTGAPESLSAMASMPSGTAASSSLTSSDTTFGQTRLADPPPWTKASSFFTSDTSGPPATPSVWSMEENPILGDAGLGGEKLEGARPDLLAFQLDILGIREVKEPHVGLDVPTRDQSQQPMGAGQDEPGNGKQPPEAGQDQQPMGVGQDQQPMGAGQAGVGRPPVIKFGSINPADIP